MSHNYFVQVTKHEDAPESEWKGWNWRSEGDLMVNGAFFTPSGAGASSSYAKASSLGARPSSLVATITTNAGALNCKKGSRCWSRHMIGQHFVTSDWSGVRVQLNLVRETSRKRKKNWKIWGRRRKVYLEDFLGFVFPPYFPLFFYHFFCYSICSLSFPLFVYSTLMITTSACYSWNI